MADLETYYDLIAGAVSGAAGVLAGAPLDLVKTRLQTGQYHYHGTLDAIRTVALREGPFGFFKGVMPPLLSTMPVNAIIFAGYGATSRYLSNICYGPDNKYNTSKYLQVEPIHLPRPSHKVEGLLHHYLTEQSNPRINPIESSAILPQHHNKTRALFSSILHSSTDTPHPNPSLLSFPTTQQPESMTPDLLPSHVPGAIPLSSCTPDPSYLYPIYSPSAYIHSIITSTTYTSSISTMDPLTHNNLAIPVISGAVCGFLNSWVATPFEMIKVIQQSTQGPNVQSALSIVLSAIRTSGIRSLWRGLGATIMREMPSVAVYFGSYELVKQALHIDTFIPSIRVNDICHYTTPTSIPLSSPLSSPTSSPTSSSSQLPPPPSHPHKTSTLSHASLNLGSIHSSDSSLSLYESSNTDDITEYATTIVDNISIEASNQINHIYTTTILLPAFKHSYNSIFHKLYKQYNVYSSHISDGLLQHPDMQHFLAPFIRTREKMLSYYPKHPDDDVNHTRVVTASEMLERKLSQIVSYNSPFCPEVPETIRPAALEKDVVSVVVPPKQHNVPLPPTRDIASPLPPVSTPLFEPPVPSSKSTTTPVPSPLLATPDTSPPTTPESTSQPIIERNVHIEWKHAISHNPAMLAFAGALAGVLSAISTHPIDLVKTKMQQMPLDQYIQLKPTTISLLKTVARQGGMKALYAGLPACVVNSIPVNMVIFLVYENVMSLCRSNHFLEKNSVTPAHTSSQH